MLQALEFQVTFPSSYVLLERYAKLVGADDEVFCFARYLIELALVDVKMNKWSPSRVASAGIFLAKKILKRSNPWCRTLTRNTNYREREVRECARDLCIILNVATRHKNKHYESLFKKFSTSRFYRVAEIPVYLRQKALEEQARN